MTKRENERGRLIRVFTGLAFSYDGGRQMVLWHSEREILPAKVMDARLDAEQRARFWKGRQVRIAVPATRELAGCELRFRLGARPPKPGTPVRVFDPTDIRREVQRKTGGVIVGMRLP